MKVWLCATGSYSDYGPTAIYSTQEAAEAATRAYGWDNEPTEYELDPELPQEARDGMCFFRVWMWSNGDTTSGPSKTEPGEWAVEAWEVATWPKEREGQYRLMTYCWAKDEAHAIKIANERRIARLACSAGASNE